MKTLYIVRHAKSSWDEPGLTDIERPLNKRGNHDALLLSKLLKENKVKPDLILSSPAKRASVTAEIFSVELDYPVNKIVFSEKIYEATTRDLMTVIREIDDDNKTIMLFGHNPSITNLTNLLGNEYLLALPTCAVVGLELSVKKWSEVEKHCGKNFLFKYPKKINK